MRATLGGAVGAALLLVQGFAAAAGQGPARVTVLVDAFGRGGDLGQDWGYAALVEYGGSRILFDTGNDADIFAHNVEVLGVDLTDLDAVVISHRHGDHTDGLRHLLRLNPGVRIYTPDDEYFGGPTPAVFFRDSVPALPRHMRYFEGRSPGPVPHGTPWKGAVIERVGTEAEIAPGIRVVRNRAEAGTFTETPELSLAIRTPAGQVVVVGCSHPGIERILGSVAAREVPVRMVIGGLHLVNTPEAELERLVSALRDHWRVGAVAPGHCTGERAFVHLQRAFADRYRYAGVGTVIALE